MALSGRYFYPLVPERFGGGQPQYVELVFEKEHRPTAAAIGIPFQDDAATVSDPLCLLFNGDDSYLVWLPRISEAARVDADLVAGISGGVGPCYDFVDPAS